jgi:outer membrane protein assembly factor BamA
MLHAVSGALRAVYERHGYPRARVDARLAPAKPGYPALVLAVDEGPRLALRPITFPGAKQVPEAELKKAPGQTYSSPVAELDALTLTHAYYDRGFVTRR